MADSNIVDINRRYYPELSVRFDLSEPQDLAWLIHPDADALTDSVNDWLKDYVESEAYAAIEAQPIDPRHGLVEIYI